MELCWCWHHLDFGGGPEYPSDGHQFVCQSADVLRELPGLVVVPDGDGAENPVNGVVGGEGAVVDDEVTLQPLRDVVPTTSGLNHSGQVMHVHDVAEIPRFFQAVIRQGSSRHLIV